MTPRTDRRPRGLVRPRRPTWVAAVGLPRLAPADRVALCLGRPVPWTYASVVTAGSYLYALRADGVVDIRWDPACDDEPDTGSRAPACPPDPSLWETLRYQEPVNLAPPLGIGVPGLEF